MPNSIKDLFSQLLPLYHAEQERLKKEKEEGKRFNVFSALNMCSDEMRLHSRLLATLLNPKASHGLGNQFLKLFLIALGLPEDYIQTMQEQDTESLHMQQELQITQFVSHLGDGEKYS